MQTRTIYAYRVASTKVRSMHILDLETAIPNNVAIRKANLSPAHNTNPAAAASAMMYFY